MQERVSNHVAGKSHVRMWEVDIVFEPHCDKMCVTRVQCRTCDPIFRAGGIKHVGTCTCDWT